MEDPTLFDSAVHILGSEDTPQLTVQGHIQQGQPLQTWQDDEGTLVAQLTEAGHLQLGEFGDVVPVALLTANQRFAPSQDPTRQGVQTRGELVDQVLDALAWVLHEMELTGNDGVQGLQAALRSRVINRNAGDAQGAVLRAGDFEAVNAGGTDMVPTGQLTGLHAAASNEASAYLERAVGIEAAVHNELDGEIDEAVGVAIVSPTNDGTITTLIGLQIEDLVEGDDTYAIHTGDGIVHFGDVVELVEQDSTPTPPPPSGSMWVYPKDDQHLYAQDSSGTEYQLTGISGGDTIPIGTIVPYAGATAPTGWLLCDGSVVSKITYADLFAVIGSSFSYQKDVPPYNTFYLPDLRGRFPLGEDNMGGTSADRVTATQADNLGWWSGSETHLLGTSEMPSHNHAFSVWQGGAQANKAARGTDSASYSTSTNSTGGGGSHNNMPPYLTLNYIIKY
ncbi:MAG: tail fiber protein [Anaerolineales bacterium]|nr:tail fiber protein [Anaerolineales bacterium]